MAKTPPKKMDSLIGLCKRRGFIYQASEIYGGINGFWDYGPLGVELKNNLRDAWWRAMVTSPPIGPNGKPLSIVGLDSAIIQNPKAWVASGHVGGFNDPMVDCRETKNRYRADHLVVFRPNKEGLPDIYFSCMEGDDETLLKRIKKQAKTNPENYDKSYITELPEEELPKVWGPDATEVGTLTPPKQFNLMFQTNVGAASTEDNKAYLRPETAQGIFLNYKNVIDTMRVRIPFGVAQVGKAFRNEVTPRNYIFRSREFEQMEMEWFCHPDEAEQWLDFWKNERMKFWLSLNVNPENLILRDHDKDELSHYAKNGHGTVDVEYRYPFTEPGYGELEGIAHRCDFDLTQHQKHSGQKMEFFDQERNERYIPHVIEPASGLTRGVLVLLCEAYTEEWVNKENDIQTALPGEQPPEGYEQRTVLKFKPSMAPIKVAVFPLLKNRPELVKKAREIYQQLNNRWAAFYDETGAIGRRYRRQDEVGTPFCVTIDFDSLEDNTITIRDRDTMEQERIKIEDLVSVLSNRMI